MGMVHKKLFELIIQHKKLWRAKGAPSLFKHYILFILYILLYSFHNFSHKSNL